MGPMPRKLETHQGVPATARPQAADEAAAASEPPQPLQIDIVEDGGDWSGFGDVDALLTAAAAAVARTPAVQSHLPAAACIALATNAAVQGMNRTWRGQDKPTNVLSFPADAAARAMSQPQFLGDIVLADGVLAAEARDLAIPAAQHLQHLVVHGLLHLMGYDHETDAEAGEMERLETAILATLGIADPYAD